MTCSSCARLPAIRGCWTAAVEAQAIDRTHRIGQSRHVFAFSLIARDTVEEEVLKLQRSKKALAEAIITADRGALCRSLAVRAVPPAVPRAAAAPGRGVYCRQPGE